MRESHLVGENKFFVLLSFNCVGFSHGIADWRTGDIKLAQGIALDSWLAELEFYIVDPKHNCIHVDRYNNIALY